MESCKSFSTCDENAGIERSWMHFSSTPPPPQASCPAAARRRNRALLFVRACRGSGGDSGGGGGGGDSDGGGGGGGLAGVPPEPDRDVLVAERVRGPAAPEALAEKPRLGSFRVGFKFCLSGQKDYGADRLTGGVVCSDLRLKRVCVCVCV